MLKPATKSNADTILTLSSGEALALLQQEFAEGPLVVDTETDGLAVASRAHRAVFLGITPVVKPRLCLVVKEPFSDELLRYLETRMLVGHNARFDSHALALSPRSAPYDTMLWIYGQSTTTFKSLDDCADRLGMRKIATPALLKEGRIREVPDADVAEYLSDDCAVTAAAYLEQQRVGKGFTALHQFDCATELAVAQMERRGVRLLLEPLAALRVQVEAACSGTVNTLAGLGFTGNLNSPVQVKRWFEKSGVVLPRDRKTGKVTTGKEALEKLERNGDLRAAALIEARGASKLLTAFLNPLPGMADADGLIYASVNTAGTKTGRFSYSTPNLQQVPKHSPLAKPFRKCFTSRGGRVAGADFSQVEMRVAAALSGDARLLAVFAEGEDLHRSVAAQVTGKSLDAVSDDERFKAKAVNFGILNGMGVKRLAHKMKASESEAARFLHSYNETFSTLHEWMEHIWRTAEWQRMGRTILGRTRIYLKDEETRPAISVVVQGSAAELMRAALVAVEQAGLRPILAVHDELVGDATGQAAGAGLEYASVMETAANELWQRATGSLPVRFLAEGGEGPTWGELE